MWAYGDGGTVSRARDPGSILRKDSSALSLQHLGKDNSSKMCSRVSTLPHLR